MGDSKTVEATRGEGNSTTVWSRSQDDTINSSLSVSDKSQNKLKETESMDWGAVKEDLTSSREVNGAGEFPKRSLEGSMPGNFCRAPGPSPSLLAALHSLGEHSDHMLLPHSLHQIAEAYFLEEDYPWAVQFLCLERLYHERLLSNLASLQKEWESQWKADVKSSTPLKTKGTDTESKCMDSLSHICRTHQRPTRSAEKDVVDLPLKHSTKKITEHRGTVQETSFRTPDKTDEQTEDSLQTQSEPQMEEEDEEEEEEEEEDEEEVLDSEGLIEELQKNVREESVYGKEQAKLIQVEEMFPPNGLVSILKRRAGLEEDDSADCSPSRMSDKRKVRFRETDDDNDEVGGASCLIFLLLCLVTVVISMGGTALYCVLSGAYSNVCTDFSQNIDFYFGPVRRSMDSITHWFTPSTS